MDDVIDRWSGYGSGLAGSLTGAAFGAVATRDPAATVMGAALGSTVESALSEASHRVMSRRQKARVGAVVAIARDELISRVGRGDVLRTDDFLRERIDGRSPADEVIEHVIQVAQTTFEERKLPYIAALLASIATSSDVDEATAHWAINAIDSLSWHKLVALAAVGRTEQAELPAVDPAGSPAAPFAWPVQRAFFELFNTDQMVTEAEELEEGLFNVGTPRINEMKLSHAGELIFQLAGLDSLPDKEITSLLVTLLGGNRG